MRSTHGLKRVHLPGIDGRCELWNLPTTMLVPRFQLIANVDPFVNNMIYDFKPHAFDPEESVIEALTSLKHDWNRGFGSQTGMPPHKEHFHGYTASPMCLVTS